MTNDKTIQQKIDTLEAKMDWFNSEEFNLDEAAKRYEEVDALASDIEKTLMDMKNDVEVLKQKFD